MSSSNASFTSTLSASLGEFIAIEERKVQVRAKEVENKQEVEFIQQTIQFCTELPNVTSVAESLERLKNQLQPERFTQEIAIIGNLDEIELGSQEQVC